MYIVPFLISIFRAIIILIRSYSYEKCKIAMHLNETQERNKQRNYDETKTQKKKDKNWNQRTSTILDWDSPSSGFINILYNYTINIDKDAECLHQKAFSSKVHN